MVNSQSGRSSLELVWEKGVHFTRYIVNLRRKRDFISLSWILFRGQQNEPAYQTPLMISNRKRSASFEQNALQSQVRFWSLNGAEQQVASEWPSVPLTFHFNTAVKTRRWWIRRRHQEEMAWLEIPHKQLKIDPHPFQNTRLWPPGHCGPTNFIWSALYLVNYLTKSETWHTNLMPWNTFAIRWDFRFYYYFLNHELKTKSDVSDSNWD